MKLRLALVVLVLANLLFFVWSQFEGKPEPAASNIGAVGNVQVAAASLRPRTHCQRLGPFADTAGAEAAAAALGAHGLQTQVQRREALRVTRWVVRIMGLDTRAARDTAIARLRRAGVVDTAVIVSTSGDAQLYVGMFSEADAMHRRVQVIERAGYRTAVDERQQTVQEYWVNAELATQAAPPAPAALGIVAPGRPGAIPPAWDNC